MVSKKVNGASGLKVVQIRKNITGSKGSLVGSTLSGLKVVKKKLKENIKTDKKMEAGQSTTLMEKKNQ